MTAAKDKLKKRGGIFSLSEKFQPGAGISSDFLAIFSVSALFIFSAAYFYFYGTGLFFHQENNSLFIFSADYLHKFTVKPGGLLVYAGNFLTQFYYSRLWGALIISTLIIITCLVILKITRLLHAGRSFSWLLSLVLACILMLLQTRYDFRLYHILGFILILTFFLFSLMAGKTLTRILIIILFPVVYYLTGAFAIIFAGVYLTYNLLYQKGILRYLFTASLILIAAVTFIVFRDALFFQPDIRLLGYPMLFNDTLRLTVCISLVALYIMLIPVFTWLTRNFHIGLKTESLVLVISPLTIFLFSLFIFISNYDSETTEVMQIEKMAYGRDWDSVIRSHEKLQSSNIVEQYYYNLALAERGELCSRMFFGRQSSGSMSLTLSRDDEYAARAMYFYYTIGLSGEAHHLAYEQMVQHGYRPENIKMLIKTELIKGNFIIAEMYINVLKKTLHYRKWAEKYEKMLFRPDLVNSDPELGAKVRLMPAKDFFIVTDDFRNVDMLLQTNPDNRIAFEYKIAKLLLEKDILELGSEIKKMKAMGYSHFPRHIEEAIVSLVNVTKEFPDLGGLSISRDTDHRFIEYFSDLKSLRGNRKLIEKSLKKTDKNTFWYYLQYGLVKSNLFRTNPVDNFIY